MFCARNRVAQFFHAYEASWHFLRAARALYLLFADGSVRVLNIDISTDVLGRLTARNDHEFVEDH